MEDDKPFACTVSDCRMTFTNEDHLEVHKMKHDLSLTLTPSSAFKTSFIDQTPTPTRFLNAIENELFQELQSDNPFDATFRKANSIASPSLSVPESSSLISNLSDTEPLSTPSITFTNEADIQLFAARQRLLSLKKPLKKKNNEERFQNSDGDDCLDAEEAKAQNEAISLTVDSPSGSSVVQMPVITSTASRSKSNATGVPTAVVVTRTATSGTMSVSQVTASTKTRQIAAIDAQPAVQSVTPVVQLIIRLPDGQAVPVQVPVVSVPTATPPNPTKTVASISPKTSSSLAKMKLKQILTSSHKSISQIHKSNHVSSSLDSPPSSPLVPRRGANGRRRSDIDDDPEEKRRKSLERNRAAATRCRQRRKQWIQTLGSKADELAATNAHLQNEVNLLRNEVAHLKTMLLAHKDCPVTQQQKASGFGEILLPTVVPINLNAQLSHQALASKNSDGSVLQLMEAETSSSQSDSISDNSEISMKDR